MNPKSTIILTLRGGKIPEETIAPGCNSVNRFLLRGTLWNPIISCIQERRARDGEEPRVILYTNTRLEECFAHAANMAHRFGPSQNIPLGSITFDGRSKLATETVLNAVMPSMKDLGLEVGGWAGEGGSIPLILATNGFAGLFTPEAVKEVKDRYDTWLAKEPVDLS